MDIYILLQAGITSILFLVGQVVLFRFLKQEDAFKWLAVLFFAVAPVGFLVVFVVYWLPLATFSFTWFAQFSLCVLVSCILYGLIAHIYVLGVFGVADSSLRIRILDEIFLSGEKGMTTSEIIKKYNRNIILEKRLPRFVESGALVCENGRYKTGQWYYLYYLQAYYYEMLFRLYGTDGT